jgi:hypothetical protein
MKLLYHTWFKTDSAHTANGINDFPGEVEVNLPENIAKVFFQTGSGFFSEKLFDLLEPFCWDYLAKVKLKKLAVHLKNKNGKLLIRKKILRYVNLHTKLVHGKKLR